MNLQRCLSGALLALAAGGYAAGASTALADGRTLEYKVGFLGIPNSHFPFSVPVSVPWTRETVGQLKALGFNTVQLNVAWGARPGDEPLNIEDVVQLS
ncbi:MAG: hypothetical protein D4R65_00855 [Verrucomicrobiaceae bacterium]|nr:MAG: hypothetical protein D4R65_00855 [Verrucomicrobiaceae bacterium]